MLTLQQKIKEDMKIAMKSKDSVKVTTLRGVMSAFTNDLISKKKKPTELIDDKDALAVLKRAVKQRRDSIEQFVSGGREDLAKKEERELAILKEYLPEKVDTDKIKQVIKDKIRELNADKSKSGMIIGMVVKEFDGNVDGSEVRNIVEELLS